jgi:hypothetical protein
VSLQDVKLITPPLKASIATVKSELAGNATDGAWNTRWAKGPPEVPEDGASRARSSPVTASFRRVHNLHMRTPARLQPVCSAQSACTLAQHPHAVRWSAGTVVLPSCGLARCILHYDSTSTISVSCHAGGGACSRMVTVSMQEVFVWLVGCRCCHTPVHRDRDQQGGSAGCSRAPHCRWRSSPWRNCAGRAAVPARPLQCGQHQPRAPLLPPPLAARPGPCGSNGGPLLQLLALSSWASFAFVRSPAVDSPLARQVGTAALRGAQCP